MKDVIISIRGLQGAAEDGSEIELVTDGKYDFRDGTATFHYMESELTGLEGTRTEFLVQDGAVTVTRTGTVVMQMLFVEGEKHYFVYETPMGNMGMGLWTQSIRSALGENGGELSVRYMVDFGSTMMSENSFDIHIKEA